MKKVLSIMFICLATLSFAKTITPSKTLLNNIHTVNISIHTPVNKLKDICTVNISVTVTISYGTRFSSLSLTGTAPCDKAKETISKLTKMAVSALNGSQMGAPISTFEETPEGEKSLGSEEDIIDGLKSALNN